MKKTFLPYSLFVCFFLFSGQLAFSQIRILTIGDSTMADYDEEKNSGEKEMRGWGQMLSLFLKDGVKQTNAAKNGRSSKSFYNEFWKNLRESIKPGDYVFIQFGHNDEKSAGLDSGENGVEGRGTAAWGQYQKYLTEYINDTRAKGGIPVLFTPVTRRLFGDDNKITGVGLHSLRDVAGNDSVMNYPLAMKALAKQLSVPLVDMTSLTQNLVEGYGAEKSKEIIYANNDNTHLKAMGGILFSKLAVEDLLRQGLMKDYLVIPADIMIKPSSHDYGIAFIGQSVVKSFSIIGFGLHPDKGVINLKVDAPFAVSALADGQYNNELQIPYQSPDVNISVFVRFTPANAQEIDKSMELKFNNSNASKIDLQGQGVSIERSKSVDVSWNISTQKISSTEKSITATVGFENLKFVNKQEQKVLITSDETWPAGDIDLNSSRYAEFKLTPGKGTFYASSVSFDIGAIETKDMYFTALVSDDPTFSDAVSLAVMEPLSKDDTKSYKSDVALKVQSGKTLYLRIYPWNKKAGTSKYVILKDILIKGYWFEK